MMPIVHETSTDAGWSARFRPLHARPPAGRAMLITVALAMGACGPRASTPEGADAGGSTSHDTASGETTGEEFVDEQLWRLSLGGSVKTTPPVGDADGNVYVIAARDDPGDPSAPERLVLVKVSAEGQVVWELDHGPSTDNAALAVGAGGDIWTCTAGAVSRVAPDGTLKWTTVDSCAGRSSLALGGDVAVSVHLRPEDASGEGDVIELLALDGGGTRLWAQEIGMRPEYVKNVPYVGTEIAGAAIKGASVYVGCDTCSALPALVELDLFSGEMRGVGELAGAGWAEPRRTTFERPRVTADAVWVDAYEDAIERRAWRWVPGSAAVAVNDSLPIEATGGLTQRLYPAAGIQLVVGGMTRVVEMNALEADDRIGLENGEPAAMGTTGSVLMVSAPAPQEQNPRTHSCWEQTCRVYVVDGEGQVSWVLAEDVVRIPYVGDGRIVYVSVGGDLVAHSAPLTPSAFGWSQWLGNSQGSSCRDCAGQ